MTIINSMCLHDVLCSSLGVIKFDVELVVMYFFENIHLLMMLKCFAHYLELLLIDILACDMLCLPTLRRLSCSES